MGGEEEAKIMAKSQENIHFLVIKKRKHDKRQRGKERKFKDFTKAV